MLPKRHWQRGADDPESAKEKPAHLFESTPQMRVPEPSWRLRVRVRFSADALERRLADGANPLASPALALRARQLLDRGARRNLALTIKMIVRSVQETTPEPHAAVRYDIAAVRASQQDLRALADRLLGHHMVNERGVAMTSMLLRDGYGPLYNPKAPVPLRYCARMALFCLDP